MIRKRPGDRDPDGASGFGRTDGQDENFTKKFRQDPWTVQPASAKSERSYSRLDNDNGGDQWQEPKSSENVLRNKSEFSDRAPTRSIANLVLDNAGEVNGGGSGALPNVDMDN